MSSRLLKTKLFIINFSKSKKRAFTLVELLTVVAIIGLLSAFAVVAVRGALVKGRDTRRIADVKNMGTAIEMYFSDNSSYPVVTDANGVSSSQGICLEQSSQFATVMLTYMRNIPQDPGYINTTYPEYCYWYHTTGNGSQYKISARMESSNYALASSDGGSETNSYEVYGGNNANQMSRGYILVSKNSNNSYYFDRTGSVLNGKTGFYVMQYEAKYDTNGDGIGDDAGTGVPPTGCRANASYDTWAWGTTSSPCPSSWSASNVVSSPDGSLIANITHTQALTACPTGFHLITNDEWMAIARDAEQVSSNWANNQIGSTVASGGGLKRGNVGITDSASYNGADPEKGYNRNTKAMLTLSNGSTIWDLSGNVYEHVSFTPSGTDATHQELDQPDSTASGWNFYEFTGLNNNGANTFITGYTDGKAVFRPSDNTWNSSYGVGEIYDNSNSGASTAHVVIRGGDWDDSADAGAFCLGLNWSTSSSDYDVGLRCAR
ncbi:MAG: prepilin-type N-terminal cleavage/methylation domain-containing protein [Candidatus Parcubacteria bacterium]|nr:prepilin-type N-terminal cleavage/methylation domain-containing protein [Candidatus Parcubacteria bacterium]